MSSQASKAELHRLLSGEKDLERNGGCEELAPSRAIDPAYFDHVGAVFGLRKDSYPNYPDCIDLHDNEATIQPNAARPYSHYTRQLQMTPGRISPHSPPTPALTPTQKGPFMSPTEYEAFKRQRLARAKSKRSVRSRNTHESTPAQSRDHSPATTTSYNGQMGGRFLQNDVMSEEYLDKSTPSHRSFASDDTGGQREDLGPFPPHPFTTYNLYGTPENTNDEWSPGHKWQRDSTY